MQNNIPFSVLMLQVEAKALEMVSELMIFQVKDLARCCR